MKSIPLHSRSGMVRAYAMVDDDVFDEVGHLRWYLSKRGYVVRNEWLGQRRNSVHYLHRFVLGLSKGDGEWADHISGDKLDCRRENLRRCTPRENTQNRAGSLRGASFHKRAGRWRARVGEHYLGLYDTAEDAAEAAAAFRAQHMPFAVDR